MGRVQITILAIFSAWVCIGCRSGCSSEATRVAEPQDPVELSLRSTPLRQAITIIALASARELQPSDALRPSLDCGLITVSTYGPVQPRDVLRVIEFDLSEQGLRVEEGTVEEGTIDEGTMEEDLVTLRPGVVLRGCEQPPLATETLAGTSEPAESQAPDAPEAGPVHITRTAPGQYTLSTELADALARAPLAEIGGSSAAPETVDGEVVAYVLFVSGGSLPERLGLRTGDRLVRIGNRSVSDARSIRILQGARRRGRLSLRVLRGGQPVNLTYSIER